MREWFVIEDSRTGSIFAPDNLGPKGYIPREAAEKICKRELNGNVWFTKFESYLMRCHPEFRTTLEGLNVVEQCDIIDKLKKK